MRGFLPIIMMGLILWPQGLAHSIVSPRSLVLPQRLPVEGTVSSPFGLRCNPWSRAWEIHSGVDLLAPAGSPVYATTAGKVVFAGWRRGYGKLVIIDQGKGWQSGYGHLSEIKVRNGQKVTAGTLLGRVGNTGLTTGPHLHYEVRYLNVAY